MAHGLLFLGCNRYIHVYILLGFSYELHLEPANQSCAYTRQLQSKVDSTVNCQWIIQKAAFRKYNCNIRSEVYLHIMSSITRMDHEIMQSAFRGVALKENNNTRTGRLTDERTVQKHYYCARRNSLHHDVLIHEDLLSDETL